MTALTAALTVAHDLAGAGVCGTAAALVVAAGLVSNRVADRRDAREAARNP